MGELEYIIKEFLKEDYLFQMKLEKVIEKPAPINQKDEYLYNKFGYRDFNNSNFIVFYPKKKEVISEFGGNLNITASNKNSFQKSINNTSNLKSENIIINKNNMTIKPLKAVDYDENTKSNNEDLNTKANENSIASFLKESSDSSLDCSTLINDSPLLSVYSLRMEKLKRKKKKLRFLNKNEFPKEYNPKILTTSECYLIN